MTMDEKEEILKLYGWEVYCYSPFEIAHELEEGFARGYAAEIIVKLCLKKNKKQLKRDLQMIASVKELQVKEP